MPFQLVRTLFTRSRRTGSIFTTLFYLQQSCTCFHGNLMEASICEGSPAMGLLGCLEDDLLANLFPACRVVLGIRVCKRLRSLLIAKATNIVLHEKQLQHSSERETELCASLQRAGLLFSSRFLQGGDPQNIYDDLHRFQSCSATLYLTLQSVHLLRILRSSNAEMSHTETPDSRQTAKKMLSLEIKNLEVHPWEAQQRLVGLLAHFDVIKLSWEKCSVDSGRMRALSTEHLPRLVSLKLGCNLLGPDGAAPLAKLLSCCTLLEDLNLRCNSMGDDGVALLARQLPSNPHLKRIDLSCNGIGSFALRWLAGSLLDCKSLTTLNLVLSLPTLCTCSVVCGTNILCCAIRPRMRSETLGLS